MNCWKGIANIKGTQDKTQNLNGNNASNINSENNDNKYK
jgi:hypothetical protein